MATLNILTDWENSFLKGNVQAVSAAGDFLSSESCVVCAGPPTVETDVLDVVPIGLVQRAQVSQNKQIQQLFELGSRKPFYIPGRTQIAVQLTRALFDGPSLMKTLYMDSNTDNSLQADAFEAGDVNTPGLPYAEDDSAQFFMNLASEFFNRPMGLAFIYNDMQNDQWGGFYLEKCFIQQHAMTIAAAQTVLIENISIRATKLVPLDRSYEG